MIKDILFALRKKRKAYDKSTLQFVFKPVKDRKIFWSIPVASLYSFANKKQLPTQWCKKQTISGQILGWHLQFWNKARLKLTQLVKTWLKLYILFFLSGFK